MSIRGKRTTALYTTQIVNPRSARSIGVPLESRSPQLIRSVFDAVKKWPRVFDSNIVHRCPSFQQFGRGRTHPRTELSAEIRWSVCACHAVSQELDVFCRTRDRFSARLFAGQHAAAEAELDIIANATGVSMWLLEARLLLAQALRGPKGLIDEFGRLRDQLSDGVSPLLLFLAFQRIDYASTALTYETSVNDFLASVASEVALDGFGRYVACRALPFAPASVDTLVDTLWQESRFSAVDLYIALIDVVRRTIQLAPDDIAADTRRELQTLVTKIADPSLRTLVSLLSPDTRIDPQSHDRQLLRAADLYTRGDYAEALAVSKEILADRPDCYDAIELWAKATINAGKLESFEPPSVEKTNFCESAMGGLLFALSPVYSARHESVQALKKLSYTLLSLPAGRQMAASCAAIAGEAARPQTSTLLAVFASALTPRSSNAIADNMQARQLVHSIENCYGAGPTTALFTAFRSDTTSDPTPAWGIAETQRIRYRARSLQTHGLTSESLAVYDQLERVAPAWSTYSDDALCGRFECLLGMRRFADCASVVTHALLENRPLPRVTHLHELAAAYTNDADASERANVAWPIFFSILAQAEPGAKQTHAVFAALDAYLSSQGVDRPSLLPRQSITTTDLRVLFFKIAVAQEVLELSVSFDSVDALDAERVAIFQQLMALDPDNAEEYSAEIKRLVRRSSIRRDLQSIDSGKVHVELDGIRRTLDPAVRVRIDYFVALATGGDAGLDRPTFRPSAEAVGDDTNVQLEPVGAIGPFIFRPIFDAIHRRYISSNEFGLDSYLSLRIRHGVLVGHIRSVFEQARLVTKRDTNGAYRPNQKWDAGLGAHGIPTDVPRDLLAAFSAKIDSLLEEARSQRIQIRTDTHPAGLFDFSFSESEIEAVYQRCITATTPDEMIDLIFAAMNDRTDRTLIAVRDFITTELGSSLSEALSTLQAQLFQAHQSVRFTDLYAAISECRTRIHSELTAVAGWFVLRTDLEHADFELPQLVGTVEEVVRKVNPSSALEVRTAINVPFLVRGNRFAHLVDVLWLLLDNVAKHAGGIPKLAEVECGIEGDHLVLSVRNAVESSCQDLSDDKIDSLQRRLLPGTLPADVRREGGSGFFKLKKILEHDLELGDSFECRLHRETVNGLGTTSAFVVRLKVPLQRVCVCES